MNARSEESLPPKMPRLPRAQDANLHASGTSILHDWSMTACERHPQGFQFLFGNLSDDTVRHLPEFGLVTW
jgi:hypothetical protein